MTNKINGLPSIGASADVTAGAAGRKPEAARKDFPAQDTDSLELTPSARLLSEGSADAPLDMARVDKLRQAIADGSYRIDADRIAGKLLAAERSAGE